MKIKERLNQLGLKFKNRIFKIRHGVGKNKQAMTAILVVFGLGMTGYLTYQVQRATGSDWGWLALANRKQCTSTADCGWCGTRCMSAKIAGKCSVGSGKQDYSCECVNGKCEAVKAGSGETANKVKTPEVWVHLHAWWSTPWGESRNQNVPYEQWGAWGVFDDVFPDSFYENSDKRIIGSLNYPLEIITNIYSQFLPFGKVSINNLGSYPYIGLYDSADEVIIRYQIESARAAGVDAFGVGVYDIYTDDRKVNGVYVCPAAEVPYQIDGLDRFKKILDVAGQYDFKVFAETWVPFHPPDTPAEECGSREGYVYMVTKILKETADHPAYLKKDNKPVVAYAAYTSPSEVVKDLTKVEADLRKEVYWFDRNVDLSRPIEAMIDLIGVGSLLEYGRFIASPDYSRQVNDVKQIQAMNRPVALRVYPGFDDSFRLKMSIFVDQQYKPMGMKRIDKNGKNVLEKQLETAKQEKVDVVWIESWNDYQEQTTIEPAEIINGVFQNDPYINLKILAKFKGLEFVLPSLPKGEALDPGAGN